MGYCDPKAIRNGKAWADVVNKTPMNPPLKPASLDVSPSFKIKDLQPSRHLIYDANTPP
jgi:hypothetical protein